MLSFDFLKGPSIEFLDCEESSSVEDALDDFVKKTLIPFLPEKSGVISIDGVDGIGKSSLASTIERHTLQSVIGLDDYLETERDCYFGALDFKRLKLTISDSGCGIIEGCLNAKVMAALNVDPVYKIYMVPVRRMRSDPSNEWLAETTQNLLFGNDSAEALIVKEEDKLKLWAELPPPYGGGGEQTSMPELRKEIIHYHRDFKPHLSADLIIKRVHLV